MKNQGLAEGEWLSLAQIAERVGVTSATVGNRVRKFEASGLVRIRIGTRGERRLNLAEYVAAVERTKDPLKTASAALGTPGREARRNGAPAEPRREASAGLMIDGADLILADEQARRVKIDADLKEFQLRLKMGELIEVVAVREAMATAGGALARAIDQLPGMADEIASAVGKDGSVGARTVLKQFARTLRQRLASEMRLMAGADAAEDDGDDPMIRFVDAGPVKGETEKNLTPSRPTEGDDTKNRGRGRPPLHAGEPWKAAGVSRATWFRQQAQSRASS